MMAKKIVVCGGNGFLGSRICRIASSHNHTVLSFSRSGAPHFTTPSPPPWSSSVQWEKADMLSPSSYRAFLKDADAVIHTTGILLEADYKGVISGRESPVAGLRRAFSGRKEGARGYGSANPLERRPPEEDEDKGEKKREEGRLESGERDGQLTYELMNRDSAIALAQESSKASVPTFVYLSAAAGAPMLPGRYISTKREAESTIASSFPKMRSIFIRPGFLYDSSRAFTMPIAGAGYAGSVVNGLLGGRLTPLFGAAVEKPVKADIVAEAVVEAIEDEGMKGVVDTEKIEELAARAWRKGML